MIPKDEKNEAKKNSDGLEELPKAKLKKSEAKV